MKRFALVVFALLFVSCFEAVEEKFVDAGSGDGGSSGGGSGGSAGGGGGTKPVGGGAGGGSGGGIQNGGGSGGGGPSGGGSGGGISSGGGAGGGTASGGGAGGGGGPMTSCGPCDDGCCAVNFCVSAANQSIFGCGIKGQACAICGRGEQCTGGACVPVTTPSHDGGVGSACLTDSQCSSPANAVCIPPSVVGAPTGWPNGYCTANCASSPCPSGASCVNTGGGRDAGVNDVCLETCPAPRGGQSSCRAGYVCEVNTSAIGQGICIPRCETPGFTCFANTTCDPGGSGYCLVKR